MKRIILGILVLLVCVSMVSSSKERFEVRSDNLLRIRGDMVDIRGDEYITNAELEKTKVWINEELLDIGNSEVIYRYRNFPDDEELYIRICEPIKCYISLWINPDTMTADLWTSETGYVQGIDIEIK